MRCSPCCNNAAHGGLGGAKGPGFYPALTPSSFKIPLFSFFMAYIPASFVNACSADLTGRYRIKGFIKSADQAALGTGQGMAFQRPIPLNWAIQQSFVDYCY